MTGSLSGAVRGHAESTPDAPALVHGDETVTYGRLYRRATRFAESLAGNPDSPIGLLAPKTPDGIALVLGCLLARRPFVLPSLTLAERTRADLFRAAGCAAVVSPDDFPADVEIGGHIARRHDRTPRPDARTFHLTTSGSTGVPKIVPLTEGAVDRFTDWAGTRFDLGPDSTVLNYSPLNFDLCLLDIWATLKHGGRVVLVDPERATNARHLAGLLHRHRVTVLQAVPMPFQLLAGGGELPGEFPDLRHVIVTGDALPAPALAALPTLFPAAQLYNLYGCTETNDSMLHRFDRDALPTGRAPLGEPIPGVSVVVVDDTGAVVDRGGTGELYVNTPFQTTGYLDQTLNPGRFVPHPTGADDRPYYRTGDLVEVDPNGRLTLIGRTDFQVKVRGVRTDLGEIDRVLAAHTDVAEAVTIAVPDPVAGNRLHAISRRRPGSELTGLELRRYLADRLPRTAIPATLQLTDDALPRTSTGKPDRQHLLHTLTQKENS
ncbi:MAG: AMP-binding protein [Actinophytocola sp.]|uniref:AMP-binding protein n=1 Tax=Actinophytocola sp. TaxID=1872138 RepID=UPI003D6A8B53